MSDTLSQLSDAYGKMLVGWIETGVPCGTYDDPNKKHVGKDEAKIIFEYLKEAGGFETPGSSGSLADLQALAGAQGHVPPPPISLEDDPATG